MNDNEKMLRRQIAEAYTEYSGNSQIDYEGREWLDFEGGWLQCLLAQEPQAGAGADAPALTSEEIADIASNYFSEGWAQGKAEAAICDALLAVAAKQTGKETK